MRACVLACSGSGSDSFHLRGREQAAAMNFLGFKVRRKKKEEEEEETEQQQGAERLTLVLPSFFLSVSVNTLLLKQVADFAHTSCYVLLFSVVVFFFFFFFLLF